MAGYIPLEYTPSSQGPAAVSREQLMQALCATMAALSPPAALPALLLKITSRDRCWPVCKHGSLPARQCRACGGAGRMGEMLQCHLVLCPVLCAWERWQTLRVLSCQSRGPAL